MRRNLIILLIFISHVNIFSQKISGTVVDLANKDPLIGVRVILDNNTETSTKINGSYSIYLAGNEKTITFKYIGYKEITHNINHERKNIILNIEMSTAAEAIGTVVISAGKFEQKIEEITVSMEVIKPDLIENKNTTNIQTAMEQVPGVNITDGQANIRGGSGWSYGAGSRVLVMVDDMPLISGDAGQVQWKLIATENIHQIEIIKGASSALYGSSALNGVINIRTSFPKSSEIRKNSFVGYTKINSHFGFIDFPKRNELIWWDSTKRRVFKGVEFFHAQKIKNLDFTIGGNVFNDDGYRKEEITKRKRVNFSTLYKNQNIRGLSYGINGNFLFQTTGSAIVWDGFDRAYIPLNNEITTTNGDTYNIDPFIQYIHGENKHNFRTRYLKVINDNSTKGEDNNQDNQSEIYYSDYQWQKNLKSLQLRITSGTTNELVIAKSDLFQGNNFRKNHSLYTQLDKKLGSLNISLGARYEYFIIQSEEKHLIGGEEIDNFSAGKPVFRTGLNYQIGKATYIRSSWGQGYRFPSMAELFISTNFSGIEIYPNPELKPESGWSSEIGIKQGLQFGKWRGYLDAAAFLMRYNDMMEFSFGFWDDVINYNVTPEGELVAEGIGFKALNVGPTEISGLELSINGYGDLTKDLSMSIMAGYTYIHPISLDPNYIYATNEYYTAYNGEIIDSFVNNMTYNNSSSDSSVLKYRYKHIVKLDAEITYKKFSLGGSLRYNDFMRNIDKVFTEPIIGTIIPGINEARDAFKNGDFIIDMRTGYQITPNIRFGAIINNLLNVEYMSRPADMQMPRSFVIQCNMKI